MSKQLLTHDLVANLTAERLEFLKDQADYLEELLFFSDAKRIIPLVDQLNSETSRFERGYLLGYIAALSAES